MPGHSPYTLSSLTLTVALLLTHMVFFRPIQLSKNNREELIFTCTEQSECWWSWAELNRRPSACKADALPTELQPRTCVRSLPGCPEAEGSPPAADGGPR